RSTRAATVTPRVPRAPSCSARTSASEMAGAGSPWPPAPPSPDTIMLLHIPDVLSTEELGTLRNRLDAADWTDGRETVGRQGAQVKRNEQLADTSPLKAELGALVLAALQRNPLFFAAALPARILPPRFN